MIITWDNRIELPKLEPASVQCCVTSPPYWGLRDYGVAGQIGLESTPETYVKELVGVFAEVWRVLRDDGTLWLNLGDSYAGGGNYRGLTSENTLTSKQSSNRGARGLSQQLGAAGKETGLPGKNLIGIPWRVAFAFQSFGWYLRSDIIWAKPNPMPESVTDRPTKSHEYIFLLTKKDRYFYDAEAIKEPALEATLDRAKYGWNGHMEIVNGKETRSQPDPIDKMGDRWCSPMRNKRDVWTITTNGYSEAHFATFPPDLIKPCILAGAKPGDVVLDPFFGSGTVGQVATELGRNFIGIELNPQYAEMASRRCETTMGLPL